MTNQSPRRWVYFFGDGQADAGCAASDLLGGKGASLAEMTRAGFNVPPGFTIITECCDFFFRNRETWPDGLRDEINANLERLEQCAGRRFGRGIDPLLLAVRSGAAQSMPGMMDTILNVGLNPVGEPWDALEAAINAVFRSWNSQRAVAYRARHGIDGLLGTAATVQIMCPAEIAGVLFTANPLDPSLNQMIVEASPGLGEAVVSGKVTPDRFVLAKQGLLILHGTENAKGKGAPSLTVDQLIDLGRLGRRVEDFFKHPCDIEWALAQGRFFLLQARAIRFKADKGVSDDIAGATQDELNQVRREEIEALQAKTAPGGTVWSRYNLAEILPEPTPMTWSIVRRFMSGRGGFGLMYRDLGFDPDPALADEGIFDLICGRPYCNLSREPRMQYRTLPFEHNFAALKANPAKALYPQATLNPARAGWRFWLTLPWEFFKVWRCSATVRRCQRTFAADFQSRIVPAYVREVEAAWQEDAQGLGNADLMERLHHWIERTLVTFARDSLKPTTLLGIAMGNLERALARRFQSPSAPDSSASTGLPRAQAVLRELLINVKTPDDADLPRAMRALAAGHLTKAEFLRSFGHRGGMEMELAQPRWVENSAALDASRSVRVPTPTAPSESAEQTWDRLATEIKPSPKERRILEDELATVHMLVGLREIGKHHLLRGYALIRRYLLELDGRYRLEDGIFFLTLEDLPGMIARTGHEELLSLIKKRRRRRATALSLRVPPVLFSDDLEAIGRDAPVPSTDTLRGVPLSAGTAEAPAWVLSESAGAVVPTERYILVCPSTDPAWVPLFLGASGLIMETGGILSHGAIVAREFGLPAVAGVADAHHRIKTGQRLRLDGGSGIVTFLS